MSFIKNWARWWGLVLFVVIAIIYYLSIDTLIRIAIESAGSQAIGAKVDIASTEFQLSPLSLSIMGLAVSNPKQPMENLFISDSIQLSLDSSHLLRRQVIVDQALISGLQLYTPRTRSGALSSDPVTSADNDSDSKPLTIPGSTLTDPKQIIAAEKEAIKAKFKAIENNIKAIEKQWQKHLAELPDDEALEQYQQRWTALKKKNWLEKISDTKALQKDIKKDLKKIRRLDDQLEKDIATVKSEIKKAKQLPEKEADRLLAEAGYSGGSKELANTLFGSQAKQWLAKVTGLLGSNASDDTGTENKTATRGKGQWVHFNEKNPHPDFLIKKAKLSGQFTLSGETIDFSGNINDITHQAKRWHKPTTFAVTGSSAAGAKFNSEGSIDLRNEPNSQLNAQFQHFKLKDLALSKSESMPISLNSTNLDGTLKATLKGHHINVNANNHFSEADFASHSSGSSSKTQQMINDALNDIDNFTLNLKLSGNSEKPNLSIKSNLDKALGSAFKKQASKQLAKYKKQLTAGLEKEFAPDISSLKQSDSLGNISEQLDSKKAEIKGFSKGLF